MKQFYKTERKGKERRKDKRDRKKHGSNFIRLKGR